MELNVLTEFIQRHHHGIPENCVAIGHDAMVLSIAGPISQIRHRAVHRTAVSVTALLAHLENALRFADPHRDDRTKNIITDFLHHTQDMIRESQSKRAEASATLLSALHRANEQAVARCRLRKTRERPYGSSHWPDPCHQPTSEMASNHSSLGVHCNCLSS